MNYCKSTHFRLQRTTVRQLTVASKISDIFQSRIFQCRMTISKPQLHPIKTKHIGSTSTNYWQFSQNSWKATKFPDGWLSGSDLVLFIIFIFIIFSSKSFYFFSLFEKITSLFSQMTGNNALSSSRKRLKTWRVEMDLWFLPNIWAPSQCDPHGKIIF